MFLWRCHFCCRHSGPQGSVEPLTIIDDPAAWTAKDFPDLERLVYTFTPEDIAELDAAVRAATLTGKEIQVRAAAHFLFVYSPSSLQHTSLRTGRVFSCAPVTRSGNVAIMHG